MRKPTLKQIDEIRKSGYRPGVVACILNKKKLLMFYKNEHKLWQLPQGGINNLEDPTAALRRNLLEDVGPSYVSKLAFDSVEYIETDKMEFKPGRHAINDLFDDAGNEVQMIGKEYYFCLLPAKDQLINIQETQFDQYFWLSFREAYFLTEKMYQIGKRRITLKIINKLHKIGKLE